MHNLQRGSVQHWQAFGASRVLFFVTHKQQIVRPRLEDHHGDLLFALLHKVRELFQRDATAILSD